MCECSYASRGSVAVAINADEAAVMTCISVDVV